jgi:hypothetical protein
VHFMWSSVNVRYFFFGGGGGGEVSLYIKDIFYERFIVKNCI